MHSKDTLLMNKGSEVTDYTNVDSNLRPDQVINKVKQLQENTMTIINEAPPTLEKKESEAKSDIQPLKIEVSPPQDPITAQPHYIESSSDIAITCLSAKNVPGMLSSFAVPELNENRVRKSVKLPNYFKFTTEFECSTVHEQNLLDAIGAVKNDQMKNLSQLMQAEVVDFDEDIKTLTNHYAMDAVLSINEEEELSNNKNRALNDEIIDFNISTFFYK